MKAPLFVLLGLIGAPACAQLLNGSFEDANGFSLQGWEWTCETPVGGNDVPAGTGQWSVRKNMGDPDCSPSYLYQRIPFAQSGDHWRVGGWVRADETGWDALPRMGFASVSDGSFTTQSWIGSEAPWWSYCWINDTVHANATDTAVVVLTAGDGFLGAGWFDGIELEALDPTGVPEPVRAHSYLDAEGVLHLSAGEHAIRNVQLFDATGRAVDLDLNAPGSTMVETSGLRPGLYLAHLTTDAGLATTRFVKR